MSSTTAQKSTSTGGNTQLAKVGHTVRLRGRNLDGRIIDAGAAVIHRNDLRHHFELIDGDEHALGLMFLCAAWLGGHTQRRPKKRLPDVSNPYAAQGEHPLAKITRTLEHCLQNRRLPSAAGQPWSGWPGTPGVGVSLLATFLWAADASTSGGPAQMVDQYGVSTLLHEGWLENPSVAGITLRRYDRYVGLLHSWASSIETRPELVEMWLVQRWNARVSAARNGAPAQPTLF